jgi:hypothetical protein
VGGGWKGYAYNKGGEKKRNIQTTQKIKIKKKR